MGKPRTTTSVRLGRPVLFSAMPMAPQGITIRALMRATQLGDGYLVAVRACMQQWNGFGAVRRVGFGGGRQLLWGRTWTDAQLSDHVAKNRGGGTKRDAPLAQAAAALGASDYPLTCSQIGSLAALCEGLIARPLSVRAK